MFVATTTTDSQPSSGGDLNRRDAKSLARRSRNHKEDRQNHGRTESWGTKTESGLAVHHRRRRMNLLFMILSRHDSVFRGGAWIPRNWRTTLAIAVQRRKPSPASFLRALRVSAVKFPARELIARAVFQVNSDLYRPSASGFGPRERGAASSPSPPWEERARCGRRASLCRTAIGWAALAYGLTAR